jgi:hypothetical protein
MIYFVLFISLILFFFIFFIFYIFNTDKFIAHTNLNSYIPLDDENINPVLNTPLIPLKSNILMHPSNNNISKFFCYDFNKLLSPVDQGNDCGSAWAIIVITIISDRIIIKYDSENTEELQHKFRINNRLSTQQLLNCYNYPNGCSGENPEDVFKWLIDNKVILTSENILPYKQFYSNTITEKCKKYSSGIMLENNTLYKIVEYIEDNKDTNILQKNIENMKQELNINGPFFATIDVYSDLIEFIENEPYYKKSNDFVGGHAVEIVGYCDPGIDKRKGYINGYWIVKNSWGIDWPIKPIYPGYFTIRMGKNECGVESRCGAVNPIKDKTIKNMKNIAFFDFNIYSNKFLNK